ncbi:MAG: prephenate dehydrogenase/arogenate dehydrogenase family protein, partial [Spirochaetaceae bacterium]|nr:prephenate dehydrogenase/arogenate dehydrogenase family protein [Spirochaetaceae bacterium]
ADSCSTFVHKNKIDNIKNFMGRGFFDTTRIAAASPGMWAEIFSLNRENLIKSIEDFSEKLNHMKDLLKEGDDKVLEEHLEKVRDFREGLDE